MNKILINNHHQGIQDQLQLQHQYGMAWLNNASLQQQQQQLAMQHQNNPDQIIEKCSVYKNACLSDINVDESNASIEPNKSQTLAQNSSPNKKQQKSIQIALTNEIYIESTSKLYKVCFTKSPYSFWVRLEESKHEYNTMMEQIKSDYQTENLE